MGSLAQNSSGAIRCSCNTRFRRRFRGVPETSEADGWRGSKGFRCRWPMRFGRFRCRWLMRFQRVVVQMADEVPESSGADGRWGSGEFWGRWLTRFQRVPVQMADEVRKVPGQMADEVPEGCGPDGWWGSGEFWADSQKPSKIFQAVGDNTWVYFVPGVWNEIQVDSRQLPTLCWTCWPWTISWATTFRRHNLRKKNNALKTEMNQWIPLNS